MGDQTGVLAWMGKLAADEGHGRTQPQLTVRERWPAVTGSARQEQLPQPSACRRLLESLR